MGTYSRRQLILLLSLVVAAAIGLAIGHWRRLAPELVRDIEGFDQSSPESRASVPSGGQSEASSPASDARAAADATRGDRAPRSAVSTPRKIGKPHATGGSTSAPLDINRASADDLMRLPGIGPVLAARIVEARDAQGPFGSVEDLRRVSGLGAAKLERVRDLVVASP